MYMYMDWVLTRGLHNSLMPGVSYMADIGYCDSHSNISKETILVLE